MDQLVFLSYTAAVFAVGLALGVLAILTLTDRVRR